MEAHNEMSMHIPILLLHLTCEIVSLIDLLGQNVNAPIRLYRIKMNLESVFWAFRSFFLSPVLVPFSIAIVIYLITISKLMWHHHLLHLNYSGMELWLLYALFSASWWGFRPASIAVNRCISCLNWAAWHFRQDTTVRV